MQYYDNMLVTDNHVISTSSALLGMIFLVALLQRLNGCADHIYLVFL